MPNPRNNQAIAAALAIRIAQQVQSAAGKGIQSVRVFLTSRVREAVSVPAPRRKVTARDNSIYYVATSRATPGAPPRKLSGKLRQSIWSKMVGTNKFIIGANARGTPSRRNSQGANYPAILERSRGRMRHPFILPTILKYQREILTIMGRELRVMLGN